MDKLSLQTIEAKKFTDQLAKYIKKANAKLNNTECGIKNIEYTVDINGVELISIEFWSNGTIAKSFVCDTLINKLNI